jgi:hypothetical protein
MKQFAMIFLGVCLSTQAIAVATAGTYGVGKSSCAEFAKAYTEDPDRTDEIFFSWGQGFMSGLDLGTIANNGSYRLQDGAAIQIEPLKNQIRWYCDSHPLVPYYMAVLKVYFSFPLTKPK